MPHTDTNGQLRVLSMLLDGNHLTNGQPPFDPAGRAAVCVRSTNPPVMASASRVRSGKASSDIGRKGASPR
jgi:hypothetical protein